MIYHIVVGDEAASPLRQAVSDEPSMAGEVIVMKDILHVGPLKKEDGQSFSALRSQWWQQVAPSEKAPVVVDDLERLLQVSTELHKDADALVWFWMAPGPADVTAYYWMLPYLAKHTGRFLLVNIANLPFLDQEVKVFYPKNISQVLSRELLKAKRLARVVTPAEIEMDGDVWKALVDEDPGIRTHEGGKKLAARPESYYDAKLLQYCTPQFAKASRVLSAAMSKEQLPTGDIWLAWRLQALASVGVLEIQGDVAKTFKDWEVRLRQLSEAEVS